MNEAECCWNCQTTREQIGGYVLTATTHTRMRNEPQRVDSVEPQRHVNKTM